jgi:DNA polymerase-3 subunit gamma/tau
MTYQVLARKYRPRNFEEMVGQEHVLRALINAFEKQRLHHAYLFTGTRGVGKTTLARIIAKCLNCETGITSKPCGKCSACVEIDTGRFIDMLEIDAASRTKVEDTRELLDNVPYAPSRGRYKVYLIDEVHMLSNHSFNALLKTLEEPPPHVKFLLATTDPQRLPVTVLSRCLQFNLKNLSAEKIKNHLENILAKENISFEGNSLNYLARAANGSVRDAMSLLDQAIAYGGGEIKSGDVKAMLGSVEQTYISQLLEALAQKNAKTIIEIIEQLAEHAADFSTVLEDLLTRLHTIAIAQLLPETIDSSLEENQSVALLSKQLSPEDVQLFYQIALIGRRDLPLAPSARSGFEMVLLRMLSFRPVPPQEFIANQNTQTELNTIIQKPIIEKTEQDTDVRRNVSEKINTPPPTEIPDWSVLVSQLNLTGFTQSLANHCILKEFVNNRVQLVLDPSQTLLKNPKQEARLAESLSAYFGKSITVQITVGDVKLDTPARVKSEYESAQLQTAVQSFENDAKIQSLMKTFNATIQPGSIEIKK